MTLIEAAVDKKTQEARTTSINHRPGSPDGQARNTGPAHSHIPSRLNDEEAEQRRSSSRGSMGIPFAMPMSPRERKVGLTRQSEPLPSSDLQAISAQRRLRETIDSNVEPYAMSPPLASLTDSSEDRSRVWSPGNLVDRSTSKSPKPGRSPSPVIRSSQSPAPARESSTGASGEVRLAADDDGDESAAADSSNNDSDNSDGNNRWVAGKKRERGRQRTRKESGGTDKMGREIITAKSLFAAAAAQRRDVSASYKFRSVLDPAINMTGLNGERLVRRNSSGVVHPHTSFDQGGSGISTPLHSDHEDNLAEMKSAQQLSLNISPIQSNPEANRCVRQVVRGDYNQFADDAQKGLRRQRVYLVSTDLSDEAAYALEWTIGTVLRDGDTLLAVYAVDEGVGVATSDASGVISQSITGRQESDYLRRTLSSHDGMPTDTSRSPTRSNSILATAADVYAMGKAEKERYQACVEVSDRCVKLLRKTRLQVRAVVEVFHCKSPKHMITEVIDFLEPTLVILGSRGRNALKGVLLGSFSNYLVTKSSVPVMVARKRLRKHSKYKRQNIRMSNVLVNPDDRLANAKID